MRSKSMPSPSQRSLSVVWIPFLLAGSMIYWTLAFGFGWMSLMAFTFQDCSDASDGAAGPVRDSYQSITVNLSDLPAAAEAAEHGAAAGEVQGLSQDLSQDQSQDRFEDLSSVMVDLVSDHDVARPEDSGQGARGGNLRSHTGPGNTAF